MKIFKYFGILSFSLTVIVACGKKTEKKNNDSSEPPVSQTPPPQALSCEELRKSFIEDGISTKIVFQQTEYANSSNRKNAELNGLLHFREIDCKEHNSSYSMSTVLNLAMVAEFKVPNGRSFLMQFSRKDSEKGAVSVTVRSVGGHGTTLSTSFTNTDKNSIGIGDLSLHPAVFAALMEDLQFDAVTVSTTEAVSIFNNISGWFPINETTPLYVGDVIQNDKVFRTDIQSFSMNLN